MHDSNGSGGTRCNSRRLDAVRLDHDFLVLPLTPRVVTEPFASARRVDNKFFVPTANSWYIALGENGLLP